MDIKYLLRIQTTYSDMADAGEYRIIIDDIGRDSLMREGQRCLSENGVHKVIVEVNGGYLVTEDRIHLSYVTNVLLEHNGKYFRLNEFDIEGAIPWERS